MNNSVELERAIIAGMLIHDDTFLEGLDLLSGEQFYEKRHRLIYNAMIDCYRDHGVIDLPLLTDHLRDRGLLTEVGGASYIADILDAYPIRTGFKANAGKLKEKHLVRQVSRWGQHIQDLAADCADSKALLSQAEGALLDIAMQTKEERRPDVGSILLEMDEEDAKIQSGNVRRVLTNRYIFGEVSNPIPFWMPGNVVMIGGPSSHGKTAMLIQILRDAMDNGASVLLFTLEDKRKEKMRAFIENISDVHHKKQILGGLSQADREAVQEARERIKRYPLLIYDDVRTMEAIRLKSKKVKMTSEVDIIAVDFVQNLKSTGKLYDRMAEAAEGVVNLADELDVTVMALSQVSTSAAKDDIIEALKGAGELYELADIVLKVKLEDRFSKDPVAKRKQILTIAKNRTFGEVGDRELQFSENWTRIEPRRRAW